MFTYTARSARIAPGTGQHRGIDATWSSCPPSLRDMATAAEILVVDDEPELCEMVAEYLMRHGFAVRTAMDGEAMDGAPVGKGVRSRHSRHQHAR